MGGLCPAWLLPTNQTWASGAGRTPSHSGPVGGNAPFSTACLGETLILEIEEPCSPWQIQRCRGGSAFRVDAVFLKLEQPPPGLAVCCRHGVSLLRTGLKYFRVPWVCSPTLDVQRMPPVALSECDRQNKQVLNSWLSIELQFIMLLQ